MQYLCYGAQNHCKIIEHRDLQGFFHATYLKKEEDNNTQKTTLKL